MVEQTGAGIDLATLPEPETVGLVDGNVGPLIHAARLLFEAETADALTDALDYNLRVWVAIKTLLGDPELRFPPELIGNLTDLSRVVALITFKAGENEMTEEDLDQLIKIDMEIAAGLLDGYRHLVPDAGKA